MEKRKYIDYLNGNRGTPISRSLACRVGQSVAAAHRYVWLCISRNDGPNGTIYEQIRQEGNRDWPKTSFLLSLLLNKPIRILKQLRQRQREPRQHIAKCPPLYPTKPRQQDCRFGQSFGLYCFVGPIVTAMPLSTTPTVVFLHLFAATPVALTQREVCFRRPLFHSLGWCP